MMLTVIINIVGALKNNLGRKKLGGNKITEINYKKAKSVLKMKVTVIQKIVGTLKNMKMAVIKKHTLTS